MHGGQREQGMFDVIAGEHHQRPLGGQAAHQETGRDAAHA